MLLVNAEKSGDKYSAEKDIDLVREDTGVKDEAPELVFKAGQSKRIWNELYKVSCRVTFQLASTMKSGGISG